MHFFGAKTVTGDQVSRGKPNPEIFLHAASLIKQRIDNARELGCKFLVMEDAVSGVKAAMAARMHCWWIPDTRVKLIDEDAELIEAWIKEGKVAKLTSLYAAYSKLGLRVQ